MRIITKNVQRKLNENLIILIWDCYEEAYLEVEIDDFQFFKVTNKGENTMLKMWQEEPKAMKIKTIPHYEDCEVWIINDGNVVTMMFPEDY